MCHFKKLLAVAMLSLCSLAAHAAPDGTITFTGAVSATTCTVTTSGGAATATITLPTISKTLLPSANNVAGVTEFWIGVSGCSAAATQMTPFFEAGANINSNGRLANVAASSPAANVEIQIANKLGSTPTVILNAATGAQNVTTNTLASNAYRAYFTASYFAIGVAGAGSVSSSVAYSIAYN